MWKRCIISALTASGLLWFAGTSEALEAEVILDRRADEMSLYIAMPAPALDAVFGQGAEALLGADNTVDIDRLYDGTFLAADEIFQNVRIRVGGAEVPVEALSMMLHDPEYLPGFSDPIDGQVSIAVCTSPETVRGMTLPELRAYMGFFAWKVDAQAAVEIIFPETGRSDLMLTLRDYVGFRDVGTQTVTVRDGGVIRVAAAASLTPAVSERYRTAGAGLGVLLLVVGAVGLMKTGKRRLETT